MDFWGLGVGLLGCCEGGEEGEKECLGSEVHGEGMWMGCRLALEKGMTVLEEEKRKLQVRRGNLR